MKTRRFLLTCAVFVLSAQIASAAEIQSIGVFTNKTNDTLKVFDSSGTVVAKVAAQDDQYLMDLTTDNIHGIELSQRYVGDFLSSNDGEEYLYYINQKVTIEGFGDVNEIDQFKVNKKSDRMNLAVGDVDPETPGDEIVVCHISANPARLKVYSYSEETGDATKLASVKPFEDMNGEHGCNQLAIADMDGDGVNDIVVADSGGQNGFYVFDADGNEKSYIIPTDEATVETLQVLDFDGDGYRDELFVNNRRVVNAEGETVYTISDICAHNVDVRVGNVDEDDNEEIVVLCGMTKSKIKIFDANSTTETSFTTFPNAGVNRDRFLILNPFTDYLDN